MSDAASCAEITSRLAESISVSRGGQPKRLGALLPIVREASLRLGFVVPRVDLFGRGRLAFASGPDEDLRASPRIWVFVPPYVAPRLLVAAGRCSGRWPD